MIDRNKRFRICALSGIFLSALLVLSCEKNESADLKGKADKNNTDKHIPAGSYKNSAGRKATTDQSATPVDVIIDYEKLSKDLAESNLENFNDVRNLVLSALSKDPDETLRCVSSMSPGFRRDSAMRIVFDNYPKDLVSELIKFLDASALEEDKSLIHCILNPGETKLTKDQALSLYHSLSSATTKKDVLAYAAWSMAGIDGVTLQDAKQQAGELPESEGSQFVNDFAYGLMKKNLSDATTVILSNSESFGEGVVEACARTSGIKRPEQAKDLIIARTRSTQNPLILQAFLQGWLKSDSVAASQWVASQLTGTFKSVAISEVVKFLKDKGDLESANQWLQSDDYRSAEER